MAYAIQSSSRIAACLRQTPIIRQPGDCGGARRDVPGDTLDLNNVPKTEDGQVDYSQDFFGKEDQPDGVRPAERRELRAMTASAMSIPLVLPSRAENSNTQRHATEFWMVEPEMAFTDLNG